MGSAWVYISALLLTTPVPPHLDNGVITAPALPASEVNEQLGAEGAAWSAGGRKKRWLDILIFLISAGK